MLTAGEECTITPQAGALSWGEIVYIKMRHNNSTVENIKVSSSEEYSYGQEENRTGENWTTVSKSQGIKLRVLSGEVELYVSREEYQKLEIKGEKFQ